MRRPMTKIAVFVLLLFLGANSCKRSEMDTMTDRCLSGGANACGQLADKYRSGTGVDRDVARAVELYKKACRGDDRGACFTMAGLHRRGESVPQNVPLAVEMYGQLCKSGEVISCYTLAGMYKKGTEITQDYKKAAEYYELACPGPYLPACYELGRLYETGLGVQQSARLAADYYTKSCRNFEKCDAWDKIELLYHQSCQTGDTESCSLLQDLKARRKSQPEK